MVLQNQSLPTLQQVIDGVIIGVCLLKSLDVCLCGNWFGQSRLLEPLLPSEGWSQLSQAPGEAWGKLFQVSIILGLEWFRISFPMGVGTGHSGSVISGISSAGSSYFNMWFNTWCAWTPVETQATDIHIDPSCCHSGDPNVFSSISLVLVDNMAQASIWP